MLLGFPSFLEKSKALFLILLLAGPLFSSSNPFQDFDDFIKRYEKAAPGDRAEIVASFVKLQQNRGGFPIVGEDGSVIFFYSGNGDEKDVRVVGDFKTRNFYNIYWHDQGEPMVRVLDSAPLFYRRTRFEKDARLDYKFLIDGRKITDPLNPRTIESGTAPAEPNQPVGIASELVMPQYKLPEASIERPGTPQGKLIVVREEWATPKITVYLPPGYDSTRKYKVVYTADGTAWIQFTELPVILNNLIAQNKIEPVIAVMMDSIEDRRSWYYYNPQYLEYLQKVVRYIDSRYSTHANPANRLHAGSSAGGAITLYVGFERPGLFHNLAMLSPSLTGPPHYYEPYFSGKKRPDPKLRIWLTAGTYEPYIHQDAMTMENYFNRIGLKSKIIYTHEGHSFGAWRRAAQEMLLHFFPS